MPVLLVLIILLMTFLVLVFNNTSIQNKKILFFPVLFLASLLWYIIYKTREKNIFSISIKIFCRTFKFVIIYVVFYCLKQIVDIPHTSLFYGSVSLLVVFDFIRAYIFELSKASILNRLITDMFKDILGFSVIVRARSPDKFFKGHFTAALEQFYCMGYPKPLNAEDCFSRWNNKPVEPPNNINPIPSSQSSVEEDFLASSLGNESVKCTVAYNKLIVNNSSNVIKSDDILNSLKEDEKFEGTLDSLVPPELYEFKDVDIDRDLKPPKESNTFSFPNYPHDSDEATPINIGEDSFENFDPNDFNWLFEEKWNRDREEHEHGKVTITSLTKVFGEEQAKHIFKVLTFRRSEDLTRTIFKENIRQINNENENLYIATECSYKLVSIIYWSLIVIEGLFVWTIISTIVFEKFHFEFPMIKLPLLILFVPILPSLKSILESFFFLVFSHPYDSGDRIHLDGENYLVRGINMMSTTLIRWDGMRCMIPNNKIKDKILLNIRRSKNQYWRIEFLVDSSTTQLRLKHFQGLLKKYIVVGKTYESLRMDFTEIVDSAYLRLSIIVEHNNNFQNGFLMWNNHSKFIRIVKQSLYILNIRFLPLTKRLGTEEDKYNPDEDRFNDYFDDVLILAKENENEL